MALSVAAERQNSQSSENSLGLQLQDLVQLCINLCTIERALMKIDNRNRRTASPLRCCSAAHMSKDTATVRLLDRRAACQVHIHSTERKCVERIVLFNNNEVYKVSMCNMCATCPQRGMPVCI